MAMSSFSWMDDIRPLISSSTKYSSAIDCGRHVSSRGIWGWFLGLLSCFSRLRSISSSTSCSCTMYSSYFVSFRVWDAWSTSLSTWSSSWNTPDDTSWQTAALASISRSVQSSSATSPIPSYGLACLLNCLMTLSTFGECSSTFASRSLGPLSTNRSIVNNSCRMVLSPSWELECLLTWQSMWYNSIIFFTSSSSFWHVIRPWISSSFMYNSAISNGIKNSSFSFSPFWSYLSSLIFKCIGLDDFKTSSSSSWMAWYCSTWASTLCNSINVIRSLKVGALFLTTASSEPGLA